jgi:hypothetical protein
MHSALADQQHQHAQQQQRRPAGPSAVELAVQEAVPRSVADLVERAVAQASSSGRQQQ